MILRILPEEISAILESISDVFHVNYDYARLFSENERLHIETIIKSLSQIKSRVNKTEGSPAQDIYNQEFTNFELYLITKVLLVLLKTHLRGNLGNGANLGTYTGFDLRCIIGLLLKLNGFLLENLSTIDK